MRQSLKIQANALCALLTVVTLISAMGTVRAQTTAAPTAQSAAPVLPKEITLTEKQIQGVLDAQKDFDVLGATMPKTDIAQTDPKYTRQFEAIAKKHGFASYLEYNEAIETISVVLAGFDPKAKTYIGPEAVLKQQIAAVEADPQMPAKDKQDALKEMNAMLRVPPPPVQNTTNIDLVAKYYDKLAAAMQDE